MGNQGTKNWMLLAFFVVSLTLIAGLFSNVAVAQENVTYERQERVSGTAHAFVPVGYNGFKLTFIYTLPTTDRDDMAEGVVRIEIPTGEGWAVTQSLSPKPQAEVRLL